MPTDALTVGAVGAIFLFALFVFFAVDAIYERKKELRREWDRLP